MITATIVFLFILGVLGSVGTWTFCQISFAGDILSMVAYLSLLG